MMVSPKTDYGKNASSNRIGLLGCGHMGKGLARNLLRHGYQVQAFDPNPKALAEVLDFGASKANSVSELSALQSVIVTCLPDFQTIQAVYEGVAGEPGLLDRCRRGTRLIETSSSKAELAIRLSSIAESKGLILVDAPLLGTAVEAWEGELTVLAGGSAENIDAVMEILKAVSSAVLRVGPAGNAHTLKSLNNVVAMTNHAILCEVFAVADENGLDLQMVYEVLKRGYGASRKLDDVAPKLIFRDHPRRAVLTTVAKDIGVFMEIAARSSVLTPVLESTFSIYSLMCKLGAGAEPPSRLSELLRMDSDALAVVVASKLEK